MIRRIVLHNWQCFRGTHVIKLEPKVYAVTARFEADSKRSNWGGKSAILEAVDFITTGRLNKHRRFNADGWITRGEKEGAVSLVLDDGTAIKRERKRGSSTKITVSSPHITKATQDAAEKAFLQHLRFDEDDFQTVGYFAQGSMSRLIRTEPEKRFDIIRGWLHLEKGEEAEDKCAEIASEYLREIKKLKERIATIDTVLEVHVTSPGQDLVEEEKRRANKVESARLQLRQAKQKAELQRLVDAFDSIIIKGKALKAQIDEASPTLEAEATSSEQKIKEAYAALHEAKTKRDSCKLVSDGEFNGTCPVAQMPCPATKEINADRKRTLRIYNEARDAVSEQSEAYARAQREGRSVIEKWKEVQRLIVMRDSLREEAGKIREAVVDARKKLKEMDDVPDIEDADKSLDEANDNYQDVKRRLVEIEAKQKQHTDLENQRTQLERLIDEASSQAFVATKARSIFRATQRRIAQRALDTIGHKTNEMFRDSGIDLNVGVKWEHVGEGLASSCEMCGAPFPKSAKIKTCESCGSERGQKIKQQLEFILSDRSGAADDWAGIGLQLAAGSWLLKARESPWATALIDEPFAQMDQAIRRAAAKQLLNLVGSSAYRQVFVISHSQETVDMMPGKIEIIVARDGTRRIEVQ